MNFNEPLLYENIHDLNSVADIIKEIQINSRSCFSVTVSKKEDQRLIIQIEEISNPIKSNLIHIPVNLYDLFW